MKKRTMIRIVSASLAFALISLGASVFAFRQAYDFRRFIDYSSDRAYSELVSSVSSLDAALKKSVYANSPTTLSTLSADIWREASIAKMAMEQLPLYEARLDKTQKFIAQSGEYAYTLMKKASTGEAISEEEKKRLSELAKTAESLAVELGKAKRGFDDESSVMGNTEKISRLFAGAADNNFSENGGFNGIEQEFGEIASLIYDGPFSSHIDKLEPEFLKGKTEISGEKAAETAKKIFEDTVSLRLSGETAGKIPAYTFSAENDGAQYSISITKAGGYLLDASCYREDDGGDLSGPDAAKKAEQFLEKQGYSNMKQSYYTIFEGFVTVNFACAEDEVMFYPDLIKVTVSRNDGSICGVDARGYIMSHRERDLPAPAVSKEAAAVKLDRGLSLLSHSLAVIPTSGQNEVFCHEFKMKNAEDQNYIVYINAATGFEESILLLIESENGTLTI